MLSVREAGYLSLLQDYGRYGHQQQGYTVGGPSDEHAFLWANKLLRNDFNAVVIEVNMGGFVGQFQQATQIALTGADMHAELNGRAVANWQTHAVVAGDILRFKTPKRGLRAYLAVLGGFQVMATKGSVATVSREQIGGLEGCGAPLLEHDYVPFSSQPWSGSARQVPQRFVPSYAESIVLRVMLGVQRDYFNPGAIDDFFATTYTVTTQSNRMGCRLKGLPVVYAGTENGIANSLIAASTSGAKKCLSEGVTVGAIQVPADGQPIILMADRQTIGGYPKLGTVCQLDLPTLAQARPGQTLRFAPISLQQAQQQRRQYLRFFNVKRPSQG